MISIRQQPRCPYDDYFEIGVLLGDGTGRLRLVFSLPVPEGGTVATVGDMNNDQKPDPSGMPAATVEGLALSHSINVSLGNGMGGFAGPSPWAGWGS